MKSLQLLLLPFALFTLASCSRGTSLTVTNNSLSTLTNVRASGSGFSQDLGKIAPGARREIRIEPRGASGLVLAFDAEGKHFSSAELGYFENGNNVNATVATDFNVSVDAAP